jgi:hypothetical protein
VFIGFGLFFLYFYFYEGGQNYLGILSKSTVASTAFLFLENYFAFAWCFALVNVTEKRSADYQ